MCHATQVPITCWYFRIQLSFFLPWTEIKREYWHFITFSMRHLTFILTRSSSTCIETFNHECDSGGLMSALMLSLYSSQSVIDLGRNRWQPTPAALLPVEVFLTQNIFWVHGAGSVFKPKLATVMILAVFKVRKQRCHTWVQRWCSRPDVGCKCLYSWGKASERIFSLVSLYLFCPGSIGSVHSRGRWPTLGMCRTPCSPFCLLARGCACTRTAWNGTLRGKRSSRWHTCQFSLGRIPRWLSNAALRREVRNVSGQMSRREDQNKRPRDVI